MLPRDESLLEHMLEYCESIQDIPKLKDFCAERLKEA